MRRKKRRNGSTIIETQTALLVIFLLVFFPLLDLIGLAMSYSLCWYVNSKISNQVARSRKVDGPALVESEINNAMHSGIGNFLKLGPGSIQVPPPVYNDTAIPPTVQISSSITVKPFVSIPWFAPVPGLNAPATLTFSSQLTRESTL